MLLHELEGFYKIFSDLTLSLSFKEFRTGGKKSLYHTDTVSPCLALKESNPPNKSALTEQINALKASKIQKNEADIEKIKNLLLKILRDIKAEMKEQQLPGPIAAAEAVAGIRAALPGKPDSALTPLDTTGTGTLSPLHSPANRTLTPYWKPSAVEHAIS